MKEKAGTAIRPTSESSLFDLWRSDIYALLKDVNENRLFGSFSQLVSLLTYNLYLGGSQCCLYY